MALRVWDPFADAVLSQEKLPLEARLAALRTPSKYHSIFVTPTLSVPLTFTATMPATLVPEAGESTAATGATSSGTGLLTVMEVAAEEPIFPAASYPFALTEWEPFGTPVVFQLKLPTAPELLPLSVPSKY